LEDGGLFYFNSATNLTSYGMDGSGLSENIGFLGGDLPNAYQMLLMQG
jgi:hypothetical protein